MLSKKFLSIAATESFMSENYLDEDDVNEQIMRREMGDMLFRIILEGADRHFWNDDNLRVHLLAIVLNIRRLDYKNPDHKNMISDFICAHKIGSIDFLQELDELGLDFSYVNKLNIIKSISKEGDIDTFLENLSDLYDKELYPLQNINSTDALMRFVQCNQDLYGQNVMDRIKHHVIEMFCTNGNPNFRLLGRVIKRMFITDDDRDDKLVHIFTELSKINNKGFFGDMEGTYEDMKEQANFTDVIADSIRKLIHKNTALKKTGEISKNAHKKKSNQPKSNSELLKDIMISSPQKKVVNKTAATESDSDSNSEDSFIEHDSNSASEEESEDGSYEDDGSSEDEADNDSNENDNIRENRKSKRNQNKDVERESKKKLKKSRKNS